MSYSRQTTHYGIPLPEETDLVNGLDWNTSSELIDSAVYEASEAAGSAATDIVAIKATLVNLHNADVQFQQDLNETNGRVSTLEQNAARDEQDIQDVADMITDKEVAQAQSDVHIDVGEWFRYNGVLYVCTVEININDTIIPNTNCRATNIEDEMPSGGVEIDDTIVSASKVWSSYKTNTEIEKNNAGDTRYDIVNEKMQYYDGTTWQDVPAEGGAMVQLDYAHPLHAFTSAGSYRATQDCYLTGCVDSNNSDAVTIDSTPVYNKAGGVIMLIPTVKIASGSTVSVTEAQAHLKIYKEI